MATALSQSGARAATHLESINPATGEVVARFAAASPAAVPAAISRARAAQREWGARPARERARHFARLVEVLLERREEIVEVISTENGKPRFEALFTELIVAASLADHYARRGARLLRPERIAHANPALKSYASELRLEPLGVVGLISPWNYPLAIPMTQAMTALLAGNAVLIKPSELTPWCGALVGELFSAAGFPAGLVEVLQGGGEVGAAMIEAGSLEEPGSSLDKLIFTGSVATGRRVAEAAARRLLPTVLELGGKDAMVVLADARLEVAASAAVWGGYMNCGQTCISVERVFVERAVAERFTELCVEKTGKLRLGPASDPESDIGPMIRLAQLEKVEAQLRDATARGARILTGGRRRPDLGPTFLEPAVVAGVDETMLLLREETFGPVLAICAVEDADEAVRRANASPFALAASVWTGTERRGREIAARLDAGAVMVNDLITYYGACEAAHGGRRASGWGRTHGRLGLLEMAHAKYVMRDRLWRWPKAWWYGYNAGLAEAGDKLLDALFARRWRKRMESLAGARGMLPWFRDRRGRM
jgi:acyl-CoA reductase-like NAD-dependent aldehyde dehydrogenase